MYANYPRPLDPMQHKKKKNQNFNILGSRDKGLEIFTFDLNVSKSILLGEDDA